MTTFTALHPTLAGAPAIDILRARTLADALLEARPVRGSELRRWTGEVRTVVARARADGPRGFVWVLTDAGVDVSRSNSRPSAE